MKMDLLIYPGVTAGVIPDAELCASGILMPVQTHSCNVAVIGTEGDRPPLQDTDAVISMHSGLCIGVRTADCVPILLFAPDLHAVAAVHAGWKGSLSGIVSATVAKMRELGADPTQMHAAFGPSICGSCYEVSEDMTRQFADAGFQDCIPAHRHIDLQAVNTRRLLESGLMPEYIAHCSVCTLTTPSLPSWRRSPTQQRLVTHITLPEHI